MARSGRKDRPIDRAQGPVAEFVDDLRRLRGALSLEEIGRRMGYHSSTLSRRLNPRELPPREFIASYVAACDADPEPWLERHRRIEQSLTAGPRETGGEPVAGEARDTPDSERRDGVGSAAHGLPDAGAGDGAEPKTRGTVRRRRKRIAVTVVGAFAVLAAIAFILLLRTPGGYLSMLGQIPAKPSAPEPVDSPPEPVDSPPEPVASPTGSPSVSNPEFGFPMRIDRMKIRIFSRRWTQTLEGDIELWWRNICPQGTTGYWVALRPGGEVVRFACNSWQYYKWTGVPPGTHHLEFWKDDNGQVIYGSGTLRSSVPVVAHARSASPPTPHEH
ncbi:helix-turn-helix domain-containing protein [Thermostaphylospora chromogena]|uniref:Helix-turn-helix domain-containing protein n=1 Tax=Thermostaphylospora chromogena TaxID=35622 RepID=A0A1H1BZX1_9ACTN|nr:helix-turn-helix transcriptional regulator [Thermostaphylospora chromogena]SDQ57507.1 Helix-turn-helix domain-containing protein [Thermostaphylospora chromogena]